MLKQNKEVKRIVGKEYVFLILINKINFIVNRETFFKNGIKT